MKRIRERRSCSGQACRLRHLGAVADELKATHDRLQAERAQLVQQQHLLSCLTDVLGQYRSALHEDECSDMCKATLEQVLLQQLEQLRLLQLPGHPAAVSNCCSTSTDSSNSSSSDPADAATANSCDDISSSCRGVQPQASLHALQLSCNGLPCCGGFSTQDTCQLYRSDSNHSSSMQPVCPDNDPFMLLQAIYNQPLFPGAQDISLTQLQAKWAADVQQLTMHLQKLETAPEPRYNAPAVIAPAESCSGPTGPVFATAATAAAAAAAAAAASPATAAVWDGGGACGSSGSEESGGRQPSKHQAQHPLEGIKELQMWMFGMMKSLSDTGRDELVFELQLTNWYTGERSLEPCRQRHAAVVQALQLSPTQQQRLIAGWRFFQGLLNPVVAERRQLHQQGLQVLNLDSKQAAQTAASAAGAGAGSPLAPPTSSASCLRRASAGVHPAGMLSLFAAHSDQGAQLQHQREQLARLQKLARKDTLLRGAMAAYLQGCLSWAQQAKLRVLMSPFHVNAGFFFVALTELMQQQQLQQQPQ